MGLIMKPSIHPCFRKHNQFLVQSLVFHLFSLLQKFVAGFPKHFKHHDPTILLKKEKEYGQRYLLRKFTKNPENLLSYYLEYKHELDLHLVAYVQNNLDPYLTIVQTELKMLKPYKLGKTIIQKLQTEIHNNIHFIHIKPFQRFK